MSSRLSVVLLISVLTIQAVACAPPTLEPMDQLTYYVQEGDTVESIAAKYGISEPALRQANDMSYEQIVEPKQPLRIPIPTNGPQITSGPKTAIPRTTSRGSDNSCFQSVSDIEQPYSDYLPLATGNFWTYHRTVLQDVHTWEAYQILSEGTVRTAVMTVPGITSGDSEETYRVIGPADQLGLWEIEVSAPLSRDGRYGGGYTKPDRIMWGRMPSSEDIIEIDEILTQESYFEGTKKYRGVLLAQSLIEGAEATLMLSGSDTTYTASSTWTEITVPAGTFSCTLEMVTQVESDFASWKTYSYYAPGVGLVKEMQVDDSGRSAYTLELVQYQVSGMQMETGKPGS